MSLSMSCGHYLLPCSVHLGWGWSNPFTMVAPVFGIPWENDDHSRKCGWSTRLQPPSIYPRARSTHPMQAGCLRLHHGRISNPYGCVVSSMTSSFLITATGHSERILLCRCPLSAEVKLKADETEYLLFTECGSSQLWSHSLFIPFPEQQNKCKKQNIKLEVGGLWKSLSLPTTMQIVITYLPLCRLAQGHICLVPPPHSSKCEWHGHVNHPFVQRLRRQIGTGARKHSPSDHQAQLCYLMLPCLLAHGSRMCCYPGTCHPDGDACPEMLEWLFWPCLETLECSQADPYKWAMMESAWNEGCHAGSDGTQGTGQPQHWGIVWCEGFCSPLVRVWGPSLSAPPFPYHQHLGMTLWDLLWRWLRGQQDSQ